jgi:hypothetical protein
MGIAVGAALDEVRFNPAQVHLEAIVEVEVVLCH